MPFGSHAWLTVRFARLYCVESLLTQSAERRPRDAYWTVKLSVENALLQFQRTMPDAGARQPSPGSVNSPSFSPGLCLVKTTVLCAFLKLYTADWENDAQSKENALFTISQMVNDIRALSGISFAQLRTCMGVSGSDTLRRELLILSGSSYGSLGVRHAFVRFTETLPRRHRRRRLDFVMPNFISIFSCTL